MDSFRFGVVGKHRGNGADSGADDQTYSWACCREMTAYTDSLGTAALVYNDRSQLTSNTDSNGNVVLYEYDTVGRVSKLTPPQGANYRTQYTYKKNGSVLQVKVYDGGSAADTDYSYNTTSGQLTQQQPGGLRSQHPYDLRLRSCRVCER